MKVSSGFNSFKNMTKQELKDSKNELRQFVKVSWLSNNFYQIGIKSTSTKDYFKYVSISDKRDIAIRFKIWFLYKENTEERIESIVNFFQEFQKFEKQIENYIDSLVFHFDELGTKRMELKLKNSLLFERKENGQHPSLSFDFHEVYKKIKTG